jgi:hypothetical protein
MKSLRVSLLLAALLLLSATTLRAQAARIACKDGSPPKIGHFTCWGHGGVVSAPLKKARSAEAKTAAKKPTAKKASARKPAAKSAAKKKKAEVKARSPKAAKHSAK